MLMECMLWQEPVLGAVCVLPVHMAVTPLHVRGQGTCFLRHSRGAALRVFSFHLCSTAASLTVCMFDTHRDCIVC